MGGLGWKLIFVVGEIGIFGEHGDGSFAFLKKRQKNRPYAFSSFFIDLSPMHILLSHLTKQTKMKLFQ